MWYWWKAPSRQTIDFSASFEEFQDSCFCQRPIRNRENRWKKVFSVDIHRDLRYVPSFPPDRVMLYHRDEFTRRGVSPCRGEERGTAYHDQTALHTLLEESDSVQSSCPNSDGIWRRGVFMFSYRGRRTSIFSLAPFTVIVGQDKYVHTLRLRALYSYRLYVSLRLKGKHYAITPLWYAR